MRGLKNKPIKRQFHTKVYTKAGHPKPVANVAPVAIKVKLAVATAAKTTRPHLRTAHFERIESVTLCGQKDAVRFIAPLTSVGRSHVCLLSVCEDPTVGPFLFFFYGRGQLLKFIQIRAMRHRGKRTSLKRPGFVRAYETDEEMECNSQEKCDIAREKTRFVPCQLVIIFYLRTDAFYYLGRVNSFIYR